MRRLAAEAARAVAEVATANVVLFTSAAQADEVWCALDLGEDAIDITVTLESAERLHRMLGRLIKKAHC